MVQRLEDFKGEHAKELAKEHVRLREIEREVTLTAREAGKSENLDLTTIRLLKELEQMENTSASPQKVNTKKKLILQQFIKKGRILGMEWRTIGDAARRLKEA